MRVATPVYVAWLVPLVLVIVVVVATTIVNRMITPSAPEAVLVKVTYGPTVISTQVVPLR